jgi:hypothetical protein
MQVPGRDYQGVIMSQVGISVHDSLMVADPARRRALLSMVETAGSRCWSACTCWPCGIRC